MIDTNSNNSDLTAMCVTAYFNMSVVNMLNHTVSVLLSLLSKFTLTWCVNTVILAQNSIECMEKFMVVG
jgi:hypothetical protein